MKKTSLINKISIKNSSEEIINRGDCCIIDNLSYNSSDIKSHLAIVMRCPVCRMDIASIPQNQIYIKRSWWRKLFNLNKTITVVPYIQCPYNPTHKFLIKNNKIKYIK
jgi:hypothetical protein